METYAANYYSQIVKAITPSQTNPATWTRQGTRNLTTGSCVTNVDASDWDKWIKWVNCDVVVVTSPTQFTNDCTIVSPFGPTNDREKTYVIDYSIPATNKELEDAVVAYWNAFVWGDAIMTISKASYTETFTINTNGVTEYLSEIATKKSRYRYRIPEGANTYMQYVVEETFTPADYDAENPELSPIVVTEKTFTWSGPGVEGEDDTWATEWQLLEAITPGEKTVNLVKYRCYRGGAWVTS